MVIPDFLESAVTAFPPSCGIFSASAARILKPFVDQRYRMPPWRPVIVLGEAVRIPYRIHFQGLDESNLQIRGDARAAILCLCTRSTDGYTRQRALRQVLTIGEPWIAPFVMLLAGEYVVEIIEDIVRNIPAFNREIYAAFVRENRIFMQFLRARATSYWNEYYRCPCYKHPHYGVGYHRDTYPGLIFLDQLEMWAN
ncbi:MAG: hypothetical protein F8N37_13215 [Telmatospirillum sp.]|nr:hypothetical protein [Telmatospirillum sp.]